MITPEMLNYVKQQLLEGMSKEMIKNDLLNRGWTAPEVEQAVIQAESMQSLSIPTSTSSLEGPITPAQAANTPSHTLAWITGIAVVVILGLGGWYANLQFFNKTIVKKIELAGNQSQTEALSPLLNPSIFVGAYDDFKIYVPKDWQHKANNTTQLEDEQFYDPQSGIVNGNYACLLTVRRSEAQTLTPTEQINIERNKLIEEYPRITINKESDTTIKNIPYHIFEGSLTSDGKVYSLKYQQAVVNGVNYSMGYFCDNSQLKEKQKSLDSAISTFLIVPNAKVGFTTPTPTTQANAQPYPLSDSATSDFLSVPLKSRNLGKDNFPNSASHSAFGISFKIPWQNPTTNKQSDITLALRYSGGHTVLFVKEIKLVPALSKDNLTEVAKSKALLGEQNFSSEYNFHKFVWGMTKSQVESSLSDELKQLQNNILAVKDASIIRDSSSNYWALNSFETPYIKGLQSGTADALTKYIYFVDKKDNPFNFVIKNATQAEVDFILNSIR